MLALAIGLYMGVQALPAAARATFVVQLEGIPARVQAGESAVVQVRLQDAPPGRARITLTLLLADWAPKRWQVPVSVDAEGTGSARVEIQFPAATHRVRADIVAALTSGEGGPATARTDIVPLPADAEIANLLRRKRVGLFGETELLRKFLAPAKDQVEDLGSLIGLKTFEGDLLVLHTPAGYTVTDELVSAVARFLESGRSVIWFAGGTAFRGERPRGRNAGLDLFWPLSLQPGAGLPDLKPGDMLGWGDAPEIPAPLESHWPTARLIWISDAPLKEIGSASPDPAAAWLLYDLFFRVRRPLEAIGEPVVLRSRTTDNLSLPTIDRGSLVIFRPHAAIDITRPVVIFTDKNTLTALKKEVPDWETRLHDLLERGGQVVIIHTGRSDLSFLNDLGISPPRSKQVSGGAKIFLQPSPLLWRSSDMRGRPLRARSERQLLNSVIVSPDGSTSLLHWIEIGKGRLLISTLDFTAAEEGDTILTQLLRSLSVGR